MSPVINPYDYHIKMKNQMLSWAMGYSYHEPLCDECCPDFSCCCPDLFVEDEDERWKRYREKYGDQS